MSDAGNDEGLLIRLREQETAMEYMRKQIGVLRGALLAIKEWKMPYPGFSWSNGSNGERDHFRNVAYNALEWKPPETE